MTNPGTDFLANAWKQQFDAWLRFTEAFTESALKLGETQLEAATEAHADAVATHKAMAGTGDPGEVFRLQAEWTRGNAERCLAYWRAMAEAGMQANAALAKCLCQPGGGKA
jgi:phasin family protein